MRTDAAPRQKKPTARAGRSGASRPCPFTWKAVGRNVTMVTAEVKRQGQEFWLLVQSDEHWDNPKTDLAMLKRHHEEALRRGAGIIKVGDTFCAMQGKYDFRADKSALRPEHQHGDYLDRLVTTAADFYGPFASNIIVMGDGNHETAIRKRHETDLIERLCGTIYDRRGVKVQHGGYTGFVRIQFRHHHTRHSLTMVYAHGWGGGGPVTKDTIQAHRMMARYDGCDIIASGHTHDRWKLCDVKTGLNKFGQIVKRPVTILKCGSYKDAWDEGVGGYEVERGHPAKPVGAWWVRITYRKRGPVVTAIETE